MSADKNPLRERLAAIPGWLYAIVISYFVAPLFADGVAKASEHYGWDNWLISAITFVDQLKLFESRGFWFVSGCVIGAIALHLIMTKRRASAVQQTVARTSTPAPSNTTSNAELDLRLMVTRQVWTVWECAALLAHVNPHAESSKSNADAISYQRHIINALNNRELDDSEYDPNLAAFVTLPESYDETATIMAAEFFRWAAQHGFDLTFAERFRPK